MKLHLCLSLITLACAIQPAWAQLITSAEIERGLLYRNSAPYDGEPFTQRYSYGQGISLFFNGNAAQLNYLDYLDRVDRAEKFGYRMPADPFDNPAPRTYSPVRVGIGFGTGYGYFRRR